VALLSVLLCGVGALAIDQGIAMGDRRQSQAASDSALLAATRSAAKGPDTARFVAMQYLSSVLGFTFPSGSCSPSSCPDGSYAFSPSGYTVTFVQSGGNLDLTVKHNVPVVFAGVLGVTTNAATAGSRVVITPTCAICILDPHLNDRLVLQGAGSLTLTSTTGEGVVVNSDDPQALDRQGSGSLSAPSISVVGGWTGSFTTPAPVRIPIAAPDPLADVPDPTDGPPALPRYGNVQDVATVAPGVYDNLGLQTQTTDMTLQCGVYIIRQSFFNNAAGKIKSATNCSSGGSLIYLACANWPNPCTDVGGNGQLGAGISIQSNGGIELRAQTSGPYTGIAIMMDRNNTATIAFQSQGTIPVIGTIYAKRGTLAYTSQPPTSSLHSAIVVGSMSLQASAGANVVYDPSENAPLLERARNRGLVR
jgi:Flp pilus assembly protein TadG